MRKFSIRAACYNICMWIAILIVILVVVVVTHAAWSSMVLGYLLTGVPFLGSKKEDVERIFKAVVFRPGQIFFDLGSGDGKIIFTVTKNASLRAFGFELARWPLYVSRLRWLFVRYSNHTNHGSRVKFLRKNYLHHSWREADVIFCYLSHKSMIKIEQKFQKECRPGTYLLSNSFELPNLPPTEKIPLATGFAFVYCKE